MGLFGGLGKGLGMFWGGSGTKGEYDISQYSDMPHDLRSLLDISSRAGTQGYNLRMSLLPQILGLLGYSATTSGSPGRETWDIEKLASPDAYTDPVTELELENAQRLLEERMARGGQAPGGTSFTQLSSEFTRNAAAARGQARNQQFARLMELSGMWEPLTSAAGGIGQGGLGYLSNYNLAKGMRSGMREEKWGGISGILGSIMGMYSGGGTQKLGQT